MATTNKYNILDRLNKMPHKDYKHAKANLPTVLGISGETFNQWLYIKENHGRMIPSDYLCQLAEFFDVTTREMFTTPPKKLVLSDLNLTGFLDFKREEGGDYV